MSSRPPWRLETIHFFAEVLRGDMSVFEFLDSDFTCVNDRLAGRTTASEVQASQAAGVPHGAARRVPSTTGGGVLTHAGILTGLSDGKDGHPIKPRRLAAQESAAPDEPAPAPRRPMFRNSTASDRDGRT